MTAFALVGTFLLFLIKKPFVHRMRAAKNAKFNLETDYYTVASDSIIGSFKKSIKLPNFKDDADTVVVREYGESMIEQ